MKLLTKVGIRESWTWQQDLQQLFWILKQGIEGNTVLELHQQWPDREHTSQGMSVFVLRKFTGAWVTRMRNSRKMTRRGPCQRLEDRKWVLLCGGVKEHPPLVQNHGASRAVHCDQVYGGQDSVCHLVGQDKFSSAAELFRPDQANFNLCDEPSKTLSGLRVRAIS